MKRIVSIAALFAIAVGFVSCNKEELNTVPEEGYTYSFAILDDATRATMDNLGVAWESGDQVGMYLEGYTGYAKVDMSTTPKSVILYSKNEIPANSYAYAYYPYNSDNTDKTATKVVINNVQDGGSNAAMPMAGIPFKVETSIPVDGETNKAEGNGTIKFLNLGSIIDFKIFSANYTEETVQYVTFKADNGTVSGDGFINLTTIDANDASTLALSFSESNKFDNVKVNQEVAVANSKDAAESIYMVVAPGTYSGTITIGTDVATYTFNFSNKTLNRNGLKHYNMNLDNAARVAEVVEVVKELPYSVAFTTGKGDFVISDVTLPAGQTSIWSFDSQYGAKITAHIGNSNYASESWLISPWIDLTDVVGASVSFDHVHRFAGTAGEELTFWAKSDDANAQWTKLSIPKYATGSDWSFVNSGEISLNDYVGKNVKVAFKYISNTTNAATWEIKNFSAHVVKADPGLAFETTEFEVEIGDDFTAPTLTNPNTLTVTYSSSNTNVASVDESTGEVEIGNVAGSATITASFAGNDSYNEGSASYTISVTDPNAIITKGRTWEYTFTNTDFAAANTFYSATNNELTLSFNSTLKKNSFDNQNNRGVQFGAAAGEFTITISGYGEGIESIKLLVSSNAATNTISAKVNENTIGSTVTFPNANNQWIEFVSNELLEGGDITFFINDASKSVYLKSIAINKDEVVAEPEKLVMSNITCTNSGESENSLSFSWTAVENAEGYQVSLDGGETYGSTQTALSYTWTGLTAGTTYTLYVKAIGDGTAYSDSDPKSQSGITKSQGGSSVTWTRVTDIATLLAGGTFIIGYEADANTGVIIPMANVGSATTSAAGFIYSGATATSGGTATINMSSVSSTSSLEVTIEASTVVNGAINIKLGDYYLGNTNTKNNCKLFEEASKTTAFTPTMGDNSSITLEIVANSSYKYLKYNTSSPRFAVYSTTPDKIVIYKKN